MTVRLHILLFVTACALVVSRRPDAIFHAQFFAEDGHVWFADAYNMGWFKSLFRSQDGYFQTLPRLAAALALLAPMNAAPLVMNAVALVIQALPVILLLSERLSGWGSLPFRMGLALIYIALPNSREMDVAVTEAQWYLALIACLLVLATVPNNALWRVFDVVVFALSGLTGPFCFLLLPIAIVFLWLRRDRWRWVPVGVFAATGFLQLTALLITDPAARSHNAPLGATWALFIRILAGHVYLGTLLGANRLSIRAGLAFLSLVAMGGTAVVAYVWISARTEFRLFLLFTALVFAGSLHNPMTGPPNGYSGWRMLAGAPGIRYWFFPTLAFAWSVVWWAGIPKRNQLARLASGGLVLLMCYGVFHNWRYSAYRDLHFDRYVNALKEAASGTPVVIPVNPSGWNVTLVKR